MRDDDPRHALMHLRRPHTQREHDDTRLLLEAGLELVTQGLGDRERRGAATMRFLWPTRAQVVERYNEKAGLRMSKAVFEDRWATGEDFSADLFAWAMHRGQWAAHREIAASAGSVLADTASFAAVAGHIALADVKVLLGATTFRVKLMICAMRCVDPRMHQALAQFYAAANVWWGEVYQRILDARGLSLRADVDLRTFTMLMTATEEGLALRFLAHPESFGSRVEEVADVLTIGALALIGGRRRRPTTPSACASSSRPGCLVGRRALPPRSRSQPSAAGIHAAVHENGLSACPAPARGGSWQSATGAN